MSFDAFLSLSQKRIEAYLASVLSTNIASESQLQAALEYTVLGGGKRVRPLLAYGAAQAVSKTEIDLRLIDAAAAAVELIHCYSLVHDDLPSMDNDALRRGRPTCHIAFGESTAVLAGDALLSLAFETLAMGPYPDDVKTQMTIALARASGAVGMVGGQAIDLSLVSSAPSLEELENMHQLKTGAMIQASIQLGALAAGANSDVLNALIAYGKAIGLAFQVQDDILDVVADTSELGKHQGADAALDKPTYVSLLGLEGARCKLRELHEAAKTALSKAPGNAQTLESLADYIVHRTY